MAGHDTADRGHGHLPASPQIKRQRDLLAGLIGGDPDRAAKGAGRLLDAYGSLGRVFAASPSALQRLLGDKAMAARITVARDAVLAGIKEDVARQAFDLGDQAVQRYIVGMFKGLTVERLHAVFLGGQDTYLADECLSEGDIGRLVGNLRLIVTRAIDLGAAGVVLIHNHPSGQLWPSRSDIEGTQRLDRSLAELDLRLVDHLIVAGTAMLSMRGANLL